MDKNLRSRLFWITALLCFLSLFLFLGQSNFHTRGEPREALVAMAMLEEGNWTLPITNGTDIAYKPPLFHWAIASLSSITNGVNEYTSRMPSAIAFSQGYAFCHSLDYYDIGRGLILCQKARKRNRFLSCHYHIDQF